MHEDIRTQARILRDRYQKALQYDQWCQATLLVQPSSVYPENANARSQEKQ